MEWNVIAPAAIGAIAAAGITGVATLWNSAQERKLKKSQLYFEKAFSALEVFDTYQTSLINKQKEIQQLAHDLSRYRFKEGDQKTLKSTKLFKKLETAIPYPESSQIEVFIDMPSTRVSNFEAVREANKQSINHIYALINKANTLIGVEAEEFNSAFYALSMAARDLKDCYHTQLKNVHKRFENKYIS